VVERQAVQRWMDAYRDAWISNEPDQVAALFVNWHVVTQNAADPVRVEYDGALAVRFADDGRCREHREWYFRRELPG